MTELSAPHLIIDGFLPAASAALLLEQIIQGEQRFTPSLVSQDGRATQASGFRSSLRLPGRIGVDLAEFRSAIHARFDSLCAGTAVAPFEIYHTECSVVAHGDGDFYKPHIDTRARLGNTPSKSVRVLSCVYYLHGDPCGFDGGDLAINRFGASPGSPPAAVIAPHHNRLAVFPSFVPHEVRPIACPSGAFVDSRFSINCWLHRPRS